jgi:hypothetical protein
MASAESASTAFFCHISINSMVALATLKVKFIQSFNQSYFKQSSTIINNHQQSPTITNNHQQSSTLTLGPHVWLLLQRVAFGQHAAARDAQGFAQKRIGHGFRFRHPDLLQELAKQPGVDPVQAGFQTLHPVFGDQHPPALPKKKSIQVPTQ